MVLDHAGTTAMNTAIMLMLIFNAVVLWLALSLRHWRLVTGVSSMRIYPTSLGLSTVRPAVAITPIDRIRLVTSAHIIAGKARPRMASYREALAYGFRTAWQQGKVMQSFALLRAQVKPREFTAAELAESRRVTRRVGSSFT